MRPILYIGQNGYLLLSVTQTTRQAPPQGGILSPLLANIALSTLDDHFAHEWNTVMDTSSRRQERRRKGLGTWRLIRYADDFVVMVHGTEAHADMIKERVSEVIAPLGLRLSESKTRITHLAQGFDFLGFRIRWMRKRGSNRSHVYTFVAPKSIAAFKQKVRTYTVKLSQLDFQAMIVQLNRLQVGWANYFRYAVAKHTFSKLQNFVWWRVIRCVMQRYRMRWKAIKRWLRRPSGSWKPIEFEGSILWGMGSMKVSRYRYRGAKIPTPWEQAAPTA